VNRAHSRSRIDLAALLLCGPLLAIAAPTRGAETALVVDHSPLNVIIRGQPYALEAVIIRPVGGGRLPVAILTHGSPRDPADRPNMRIDRLVPQARDLAHRGWLAVAFLRRGFGPSQGSFVEGYTCASPNYRKAFDTAAEDIEAVRVAVARRPDADTSRILGFGVSVGGAAMLAWGTTRPEGLLAVVNVSGGSGASEPGHNCDEAALVSALASIGTRIRVPTLWLYAENDSYFGPEIVRRMYDAFTASGGSATLTVFGPVDSDGHVLCCTFEGRKLWLPRLDQFLRTHQLPTWPAAPLDGLAQRMQVDSRRVLASYLEAPSEKALSVSGDGRTARFWGGAAEVDAARQKSRELCERDSRQRCKVLVENFQIVLPAH
jgi:dienelactone hydrolase